MPADQLIAIATILRPQGRKGEVLAELLTDLIAQVQVGRSVYVAKSATALTTERMLENYWLPVGKNAGRIVLKLSGSNSISEAEGLTGLEVLVPASELPELDEDTFYVRDLIGCTLFDRETSVGCIVDLQFATSTDGKARLEDVAPLLVIESKPETEPILVPFAKAYLQIVDIAEKRVVMNLPDGLFDSQNSLSEE